MIIGCYKEPINIEKLTQGGGIYYDYDTGEPYSGKVFILRKGNKDEGRLIEGRKDGLWTYWKMPLSPNVNAYNMKITPGIEYMNIREINAPSDSV